MNMWMYIGLFEVYYAKGSRKQHCRNSLFRGECLRYYLAYLCNVITVGCKMSKPIDRVQAQKPSCHITNQIRYNPFLLYYCPNSNHVPAPRKVFQWNLIFVSYIRINVLETLNHEHKQYVQELDITWVIGNLSSTFMEPFIHFVEVAIFKDCFLPSVSERI